MTEDDIGCYNAENLFDVQDSIGQFDLLVGLAGEAGQTVLEFAVGVAGDKHVGVGPVERFGAAGAADEDARRLDAQIASGEDGAGGVQSLSGISRTSGL